MPDKQAAGRAWPAAGGLTMSGEDDAAGPWQDTAAGEDDGEYIADRRVRETRPVAITCVIGGPLRHAHWPEPGRSTRTLCPELPVALCSTRDSRREEAAQTFRRSSPQMESLPMTDDDDDHPQIRRRRKSPRHRTTALPRSAMSSTTWMPCAWTRATAAGLRLEALHPVPDPQASSARVVSCEPRLGDRDRVV